MNAVLDGLVDKNREKENMLKNIKYKVEYMKENVQNMLRVMIMNISTSILTERLKRKCFNFYRFKKAEDDAFNLIT